MNREALAWAAGFFDGEGCLTVFSPNIKGLRKRARGITMQITQRGREPLDRFRAAVGCGRVNGPYTNGRTETRDVYRWHATSKAEVHHAIWMLWHWLSGPKRRQIDEGLARYHDGVWDERRGRQLIWGA